MKNRPSYMIFLWVIIVAINCTGNSLSQNSNVKNDSKNIDVSPAYSFLFDSLLADGFDFPIGNTEGKGSYTCQKNGKTYDGWYIATETAEIYSLGVHTGEDWNGVGGGDTDEGQPVYAIGQGMVIAAEENGAPWGNCVMIEHKYIENGKLQVVYSLYVHLKDYYVKKGDIAKRRQQIGTIGNGDGAYPAHLHLEIRKESMKGNQVTFWPSSAGKDRDWVLQNYADPTDFINAHRIINSLCDDDKLLVAVKQDYKLYVFEKGSLKKEYEIALSLAPEGHKEMQGDNRLPEGEYRILDKSAGPFDGSMSEFFGAGWMRISYPNSFDAQAGYEKKYITQAQRDAIIDATKKITEPPKTTKLGGGIGIHGWAGNWSKSGSRHLTWGCISMLNDDLKVFVNEVPFGTRILILP